MLNDLGDIVEIYGKNVGKMKKMVPDATSFEVATDACRCLGGVSPYRMQKVRKKLAGSVKGAYLCSVKNNKSRKGQAKRVLE